MKADRALISRYLRYDDISVSTVDCIASTNDEMKNRAIQGNGEIAVLIAESQTKGKGTKGRSFFSPDGSGCYMSFLLRPPYPAEDCALLTVAAAAAVAKAVDKFTCTTAQIKWVNDIYVGRKKVAGILTEASFAKNGSVLEYAVVGIGINLRQPEGGFTEEIKDIAAAINLDDNLKNEFIAEIINLFIHYYKNLTAKEFLGVYREKLFFIGETVSITQGDSSYEAKAVGIDDMGHLIVETRTGERKTLFAGEITVRQV